jgi:predicted O-methyltransferase YrrM
MIAHAVRKQTIQLARRGFERAARRRVQADEGLWRLLQAYLAKTDSTGCDYVDYDVLHRRIRQSKPREVLECGTGASSVVVAHALWQNARENGIQGRVTSMEESEHWFEMADRLLPDELRDHVDMRLSAKTEDAYTIFRGVRYADVPNRRYELVFIDGPGTLAPSDGTRSFDFDFIHVVRGADHLVSGIVDGRYTTCYVLEKIFGPERFRFDVFRNLAFVGPCTRHGIKTITKSSSIALSRSLRALRPTRFHLAMEPSIEATQVKHARKAAE